MDMDSSHPNWLVFSLSNHSHQLSLFQPSFNSNPSSTTDHHLSVLGGGQPKLEDFLGGSGGSSAGPTANGVAQFDSGAQGINMSGVELYDDSELKTIAASFLRGFSTAQTPAKKSVETFGQRTSIFRGVTRHRWTGRYEAHLWDNSCRREGQSRKGRQVYLGGYDKEEKAARAYDLAALKYWGPTTTTNFPVSDYEREMEEMKHMTRQEFVASLRRKSSGFSRGLPFTEEHHQHGRWQARIGRVAGNKDLYLGTFSTQEEAAEAYDIAAIKFRGLNAVTNFDMSRYDVRSIASSNLPIGGASNKPKTSSESLSDNKSLDGIQSEDNNKDLSSATSVPFPSQNSAAAINFAMPIKQDQSSSFWAALGYQCPAITNNAKNPNTGATLFQDSITSGTTLQGTTPFSMEFQPSLSVNTETNSNNEGFFNGCGGYYQQQGSGTTSSSPSHATRIVSNNGTAHDAVVFGGNGSWMPPSVHSFQAAKPNLSAFQTPIFGME
ncbi:hypothetical protein Pfo_000832 [Paulownia fortunei]|nr:hypothetical protein Pfo_000832 [Paulownia fortunei]